jgi:hypothetical protein
MSWYKKNSGGSKASLRCKAHMTVSTQLPSGVLTPIAMNAIDYDTDNTHTNDPTKFIINTPGLYLIVHQEDILTASGGMDAGSQWSINVGILKNGIEGIAVSQPSNDGNVSALVYLNEGDYIQPVAIQSSGAVMHTYFTDAWCPYISIAKIGD